MANRESAVQKLMKEAIETKWPNCYIRKIHQSAYSHNGIPDLLACIEGDFIALEIKTDTGKVSKLQALEINAISEAGGLAVVVYGRKDIPYILDLIEGFIDSKTL